MVDQVRDSLVLGLGTATISPSDRIDSVSISGTNLIAFGYHSPAPLANVSQMLATNGLECIYQNLGVYVYDHATNDVACLNMPATNLLRIALLDKTGNQVEKTALGMMYGLPLSEEQIDSWFHQRRPSNQNSYILLFPFGLDKMDKYETPREICQFSYKNAFEIKEQGEYRLHLQMRMVQIGQDSSGKLHYPVTWLPEISVKIQIRLEDIPSSTNKTK